MWSFAKKPETKFRRAAGRLMTASWHRPGVLGDAVALPSVKPLPEAVAAQPPLRAPLPYPPGGLLLWPKPAAK